MDKGRNPSLFRVLTSPFRSTPDFFIIGTAKGGTTSMYQYLIQHPDVIKPTLKEIRYFAFHRYTGLPFLWYKAHFPLKIEKIGKITGEGDPNTIFNPQAPKRIKKKIPKIKLIILLRNPVDRAYSAWNMHYRAKKINLSFEEALENENKEYSGLFQKYQQDEKFWVKNGFRFAYLQKGIYVDQLKEWFKFFAKNQILIIKSEDFLRNTPQVLSQVFDFLGLPQYDIQNEKKWYANTYKQKMNPETRKKLIEYFKPHNERLSELLGKDFGWDV